MAKEAPKPKEKRGTKIPEDLQRFLADVHRQIEAGDEAATMPSDDLLQARCAYGGRISEDSQTFGFTYFHRETDGQWEFFLTSDEIRGIGSGETTSLDLWHCKSTDCGNAFSQKNDLCDDCDWEQEEAESAPPGSTLADLVSQMQALDPEFGKVRNDPGEEFAFEVTAPITVAAAAALSESEAVKKIQARDDFGAIVNSVPLEQTTRGVLADPFRSLIPLGDEESIPPGVLIHRVACGIMAMVANPKEFDLYEDELEDIKTLRFYRFFHAKADSWWSCTFDPDAE